VGIFIAIEGGDGSGKGTQSNLLEQRLKDEGYDVLKISFPQYGKLSAVFAERYLNGKYGSSDQVHPELGSLAYAIDRYDAGGIVRAQLQKPKSIVIADRYVASNLAHQGAKIEEASTRQTFYQDIMDLEYGTLGIPRPELNIVLLVPSKVAQRNVDKKAARSYTSQKRDIHEADAKHLELAKANYEELCQLYPDEFQAVECMANSTTMRSIENIQTSIWQRVTTLL